MIIIAIFFFIHQKVEKMMEKKLVWEDYYGRRERKETNTSLVELCMNFHHYYIKNWWGDGLYALKFHCKKILLIIHKWQVKKCLKDLWASLYDRKSSFSFDYI